MIHARDDYNRFQDPALADPSLLAPGASPIAEDEPVMLFRAKDKHFVEVLGLYRLEIMRDRGFDAERDWPIIEALDAQIARAQAWQETHGVKHPDL